MISTFINHQWKSFWRSRNKTGSIAAQIALGFFMLYFLVIALVMGVTMKKFLGEIFPNQDVITSFNGIILYYFALDLIARLQLQELPTLSVIPYLHLRIPKNKIINFLNTKAILSAFNIWPFFIFVPFIAMTIATTYGSFVAAMYLVVIFSVVILNNFLILYLKRKSITNIIYTAVALGIVAIFGALEYFKVISLIKASDSVFRMITEYPAVGLIVPLIAWGMFKVNAIYLHRNLYVEELSSATEKKASTDYAFLNRFGSVGTLAALELKLILRHKRSRSTLLMALMFLFYGFLFYKGSYIENDEFGKMIFAAVFMTGISVITYGQFMFGWQSAHFDGLLSNKINFKDYIKAKFLLFTIGCTVITIAASFYGFISPKILLLHLAAYLYNIGFGTVIVLYFATNNFKRLDITKSASFNWQGTGATQWILSIPFILLPFVFYLPFGMMNMPYIGLITLAAFGLITLMMREYWVNLLTKRFEKQRYKIAEGFRE